jgi:hypothetical protein
VTGTSLDNCATDRKRSRSSRAMFPARMRPVTICPISLPMETPAFASAARSSARSDAELRISRKTTLSGCSFAILLISGSIRGFCGSPPLGAAAQPRMAQIAKPAQSERTSEAKGSLVGQRKSSGINNLGGWRRHATGFVATPAFRGGFRGRTGFSWRESNRAQRQPRRQCVWRWVRSPGP